MFYRVAWYQFYIFYNKIQIYKPKKTIYSYCNAILKYESLDTTCIKIAFEIRILSNFMQIYIYIQFSQNTDFRLNRLLHGALQLKTEKKTEKIN